MDKNEQKKQTTSTQVSIDPEGFDHLSTYIEKLPVSYRKAVLISDEDVYPLYGEMVAIQLELAGIQVDNVILAPGEAKKTIEAAYFCWESFLKFGIDRSSLAITLGGGVISDLGGFVASTYMRGIDLIHLPTTLLGMLDASIGGKTAINFSTVKNLIGSFYHPKLVLIDTRCLQTLPMRHYKAGLAELIKYGIIADPLLLTYLEQQMSAILKLEPGKLETVISHGCEIKSNIVMQDEQDRNIRAILNYGHTFAHALESASQYQDLLHGEAVAIGMSCAAYLSELLDFVDEDFIKRQDAICHLAGLSTEVPKKISNEILLSFMQNDKKSISGSLSFVLAQGFGKIVKVDNVERGQVMQALDNKRTADQK